MKCDLCNIECDPYLTPAWTYRTVNTVTSPTDPTVPAGLGIWAEDEEWLVCVDCHLIIESGNQVALAARSIMMQREQMEALSRRFTDTHQAEIVRIHKLFWTAKSIHPPVPEPGHRA